MSKWLLSIVGISCLGILIDILISNNRENKFIKGIYSIITVCVIIEPIIILFKNNNLSLKIDDISIDSSYIAQVNSMEKIYYEDIISKKLESYNYEVISIKVYIVELDNGFVKQVIIRLKDKVDNINKEKINNIVNSIMGNAQIIIYS